MRSPGPRRWLLRLGTALLAGGLGGFSTLASDSLLARWMLGFSVSPSAGLVLASAGFGMLLCGLYELALLVTGRNGGTLARHWTTAVAVLYGGSIYERVEQWVSDSQPVGVAAGAAVLALLIYGLFILALARILEPPPRRSAGFSAWRSPSSLGLGAAVVALGLAANRHLLYRPSEPAALWVDAAIVALGLAAAFAWRGVRGRRAGALGCALFLGLCAALATLRGLGSGDRSPRLPAGEEAPEGPHLVLLTIDTLRKDIFDAVVEETPEGHLLKEAIGPAAWFDNAIAAAPWTAPSMASILTGLYPPEHGYGFFSPPEGRDGMRRLDASIETLAEVLWGQGYLTAAIVTNPYLHPAGGLGQGFFDYEWIQDSTGSLPIARFFVRIGWLRKQAYTPADVMRGHFARLLQRLPDDRPAFLWAHLMDPHGPLRAHRDLPPEPPERVPKSPPGALSEALYREETRFVCRELAGFIELLKRRGLWPRALFVLAVDHGEMFARDAHRGPYLDKFISEGHGHALYGELVRVPLIIRPPGGLVAERRIDALISHVDLYGTILDLLGIESPLPEGDRVSFAPWLQGKPPSGPPPREHALTGALHTPPQRYAIRKGRFKLFHSPSGHVEDELYDLETDMGETRNLAEIELEKREELRALLEAVRFTFRDSPEGEAPLELDPKVRRQLEALGYL